MKYNRVYQKGDRTKPNRRSQYVYGLQSSSAAPFENILPPRIPVYVSHSVGASDKPQRATLQERFRPGAKINIALHVDRLSLWECPFFLSKTKRFFPPGRHQLIRRYRYPPRAIAWGVGDRCRGSLQTSHTVVL